MTSVRKRKRRQHDGLRRMIEASERLGLYELEYELINARNAVSDAELVARINAAPDMGDALLVELSKAKMPDVGTNVAFARYALSSVEEEMLTSITTSGKFTLEAAIGIYADVQRQRITPRG